MRKDVEKRYLDLFEKSEPLTQKEVAQRLSVSITSASNNLRTLYEKGKLRVIQKPGMSMRYKLTDDFSVISMPNGEPLYTLYDSSLKEEKAGVARDKLIGILVTKFLDSLISQEDIENVAIPDLNEMIQLLKLLSNASTNQVKATKQALIEYLGSSNGS